MFGGWESYEAFEEGWPFCKFKPPIDWRFLNTCLISSGISARDIAQCISNRKKSYTLYKLLTSAPESALACANAVKKDYVKYERTDWRLLLLLAHTLNIDPALLVDERKLCQQTFFRSSGFFRSHKILFTAWEQGVSLRSLIPEWFGTRGSYVEDLDLKFFNTVIMQRFSQSIEHIQHPIRMGLVTATKLGIPLNEMFMAPPATVTSSPIGVAARAVSKLTDPDAMFLYAVTEVLASKYSSEPEALKEALGKLVDLRWKWRRAYEKETS